MSRQMHFDIDPTIQDWGVSGHYDYDELYETIRANILREYPDAKITREQYVHNADSTVIEANSREFDESEFYDRVESCEWVEDEEIEHPIGTIAYCKVCGNYVQLELSPEIGEYWALVDARELTEADKAYAVDIHCGC